jgi:fructose-1,6-bisphosphatase/inositol monophosphatase family enzyme
VLLASAIHLTLEDELFVAERGLGAFRDGVRLLPLAEPPAARMSGTIFSGFMPRAQADELAARASRAAHELMPPTMCAAHEYAALARGRKDYALYYRILPWDHAAGALLLRELGGVARHPDGRDYDVRDGREPTLMARSEETWTRARAELFGPAGAP